MIKFPYCHEYQIIPFTQILHSPLHILQRNSPSRSMRTCSCAVVWLVQMTAVSPIHLPVLSVLTDVWQPECARRHSARVGTSYLPSKTLTSTSARRRLRLTRPWSSLKSLITMMWWVHVVIICSYGVRLQSLVNCILKSIVLFRTVRIRISSVSGSVAVFEFLECLWIWKVVFMVIECLWFYAKANKVIYFSAIVFHHFVSIFSPRPTTFFTQATALCSGRRPTRGRDTKFARPLQADCLRNDTFTNVWVSGHAWRLLWNVVAWPYLENHHTALSNPGPTEVVHVHSTCRFTSLFRGFPHESISTQCWMADAI
jgi:hypothetical protein